MRIAAMKDDTIEYRYPRARLFGGRTRMRRHRLFRALLGGALAAALTAAGVRAFAQAAPRVDVHFDEWPTMTRNIEPRGPAVAPDGGIWYAAPQGNILGRLDPATGKLQEFTIPIRNAGPQDLVVDANRNVWYTAHDSGNIGRYDSKSRWTAAFRMPSPKATGPQALALDPRGVLWFTLESGGFVGRMDLTTRRVSLTPPFADGVRPFGIALDASGAPYFAEANTNRIGRVDPQTMKVTEYPLPDKAARPRRLAVASDGAIFYTDYARGALGRLDPKTGQVSEHDAPGGAASKPDTMAITPDGAVWFCETGAARNQLVRFVPATGRMQSFAIPGGGVGGMVSGPKGELWLTGTVRAESCARRSRPRGELSGRLPNHEVTKTTKITKFRPSRAHTRIPRLRPRNRRSTRTASTTFRPTGMLGGFFVDALAAEERVANSKYAQ